jgi:DNA-binding LytR/AlgR family response regulator
MKIAIVDDEIDNCNAVVDYIKKYSAEYGIATECRCFCSGLEFLSDSQNSFDIIFIDVEMSGYDGFETAQVVREHDDCAVIIFMADSPQQAIRGYEYSAVDFLIKPIKIAPFTESFKRAIELVGVHNTKNIHTICSERKLIVLKEDDIYYIEGLNQYVVYHTIRGDFKVHTTLKSTEEGLKGSFSRCNNSFIVNLAHVSMVYNNNEILVGPHHITISRGRKTSFLESLDSYLGIKE